MSTTVASLGSGTATSLINLAAVKPKPATDRGLALPSLTLTDDGSGPRLRNLVLELPDLDRGDVAVASRLGDQPLPAVFRAAPLAGSALASPMRGLTFTTTGIAPLSLSFGQMGTVPATGAPAPGSPALAAAAVSFTPNTRLSVRPKVLIPVGSPGAQTSVGTAIQANVVGNLALVTDVGMAGAADTAWAPLVSARLVGQWPRAGIETSVLRGAAAPRTEMAHGVRVVTRSRGRAGTGAAAARPHPCGAHELVAPRGRPGRRRHDTGLAPHRLRRPPGRAAGHGSAAGDDGLAGVGNHLARMAPARPGPHGRALRAATSIRLGAGWGRRGLVSRRSGPSRARPSLCGMPGPARRPHGGLQLADRPWL